jgi:hypothetical protein
MPGHLPQLDNRQCCAQHGLDSNLKREATMAKAKRTTHRSSTGKKLYAVRDSKGRFKDIQTYQRAHSADIKRKSKKEK